MPSPPCSTVGRRIGGFPGRVRDEPDVGALGLVRGRVGRGGAIAPITRERAAPE